MVFLVCLFFPFFFIYVCSVRLCVCVCSKPKTKSSTITKNENMHPNTLAITHTYNTHNVTPYRICYTTHLAMVACVSAVLANQHRIRECIRLSNMRRDHSGQQQQQSQNQPTPHTPSWTLYAIKLAKPSFGTTTHKICQKQQTPTKWKQTKRAQKNWWN